MSLIFLQLYYCYSLFNFTKTLKRNNSLYHLPFSIPCYDRAQSLILTGWPCLPVWQAEQLSAPEASLSLVRETVLFQEVEAVSDTCWARGKYNSKCGNLKSGYNISPYTCKRVLRCLIGKMIYFIFLFLLKTSLTFETSLKRQTHDVITCTSCSVIML